MVAFRNRGSHLHAGNPAGTSYFSTDTDNIFNNAKAKEDLTELILDLSALKLKP
jgi:hypothetical protein